MLPRIIVSFTSYPARIKTVGMVLDSIVQQTILPDKIVLYLSSDQFYGYKDLPDFSKYKRYGFGIYWNEEDLGPHKKYYYAMQQYPNDIIVTIDDDIYYKNTMIEELLYFHKKYPKAVITRRAHLVTWMENGTIAPYEKWYLETLRYIGTPRTDLVATGCAGVLYPPYLFKQEIFNKNIFVKNAFYADDLWLKVMELYNEIPVVLTKNNFDDPGLENYSVEGLYCNQNANSGNDEQLRALLKIYGIGVGKENFLVKRLGVDGKLLLKDLERARRSDIFQIIDEHFKWINNQETVLIYGAGNVAEKLYKLFEKIGYLNKIDAFIVKNIEENKKELGGIKVKNYIDFVNSSQKIIIGLFISKQDEVYKNLITSGITKDRIVKLNPFINKLISMI